MSPSKAPVPSGLMGRPVSDHGARIETGLMEHENMTKHEKHMEFVDRVNNSASQSEHWNALRELNAFREGLRAAGHACDLILCDQTQFNRGHETRPMCCGVFLDWAPND